MVVIMIFGVSGCFLYEGESAYEIAVRNGFVGTEKEWLESLKGTDGEKGDTGERGASGTDGKDGQNFNSGYTAKSLYDEAVANGYQGDFMTFIKEIFGSGEDLTEVINKGLFTTCNIIGEYYVNSSDGTEKTPFRSGGTGVFYSVDKTNGDALIITNYHVLYNTSAQTENNIIADINVYLYGDTYFQTPMKATYIGGSATYDLALIEVKSSELIKNGYVQQAVFGDSEDITIGETVLAIGNPGTDGTSVTRGTVNVPSEHVVMDDVHDNTVNMHVVRYDAEVNPGNSGGGLFNAKGELIGIVNAKLIKTNYDGIGYAITSNLVKAVAENIIDNCYGSKNEQVVRPYFGIYTQVQSSVAVFNEEKNRYEIIETIVVNKTEEGSMLEGRIFEGDVFNSYTYAGKTYEVKRLYDISEFLLKVRIGDVIVFNITAKDGTNRNLTVTITEGYLKYVD